MDLREFISRALCDIVNGVQDAQKETNRRTIVPPTEGMGSELTDIEFEVTVKADERSGSEAKLSVVAVFVGGGVKGASDASSGHAAKLTFRVPVRLPRSK